MSLKVLNCLPIKKSRMRCISERISLVRKKRSIKAPGDFLLQAALKAISSNDFRSAKNDLTKYLQIIPNVSPEERAIIENSIAQMHVRLRLPVFILKAIGWFVSIWIQLKNKSLMSYKILGKIFPNYIDEST